MNWSARTFRELLITVAFLIILGASAIPVWAQYRASLQGTITDPQGDVVPGAKITLTSTETNIAKTVTSSGSGVYSVTGLAPGTYDLVVEKQGFAKQTLNGIRITSEQAQGQDVQLQLENQSVETVTVSANVEPAIDTENANIAGTISSRELQALPTFGRDPFQVAQLAPGTFGDNSRAASGTGANNLPGNAGPGGTSGTSSIFSTENQVQISANGTRTNSNSYQVDGVSVNSLAWGGAAVITPNEESVKEVTVQSNPYSAENGRNSGAQVLVVSQNGTNQFHGSALFKADRPGLNAYQRYNGPNNLPQRDNDRFNQWAGSLGGPIVKNHLFFFFSYETLRNSSFSTGLNWYETPQFLSLVKSASPNSIGAKLAGYPGEGVSYNAIVPKTCADAGLPNPNQCQAIFSNGQYQGLDIGSPLKGVGLGVADPSYVSNGTPGIGGGLDGIPDVFYVQTVNPTTQAPEQYNGRIDFQATSKDLIAFTTYYVPNDSTSYNGPVRAANLWHSNRLNETAALLWDRTVTATILNEARFNVTRWKFDEIASNPQEPWGLPQAQVDNAGNATISGQYLGAPGPGVFAQTTYNFRDTATMVFGNHSIKVGPDLYWEQDADTLAGNARPNYYFRNLWDFANDAPYQEFGNFDPKTGQPTSATKYIRSGIFAGFIQDDYRARPNLTLNLGLRWEYFQPVHEKYNNFSNIVLGAGSDPLTGARLKVGGDLYQPKYNNWGPQVGFAWRPNPNSQRFVVRGGFGIGYNREEQAITLNGRANPPLVSAFTLTGNQVLYQVPGNVNQFYGWPVNQNAKLTIDPNTNLPLVGAGVTINGFPQNLPTTYTFRYSLDTQYDLGGNWVAKLGYQGSSTRHYARQNNLNLIYQPLNPQIQTLYYFTNDANSSYNAMLAELEHRFAHNFQMDFQYRWAHAIDVGSNDYYIGYYPYGLQYLRGSADYDVRHLFKLYGVYSPTLFANGHGWKSMVFGGWQVSGIFNYHTGFPWTPRYANTGCNVVYQGSGYCNLYPAGYSGGAGTDYSNSTFEKPNGNFPNGALAYFTVPTFQTATFPASGGPPPVPSVGRNLLRGPNYFDIDMTLQKSFGLPKLPIFGENARFEFRANAYNLFNKTNLLTMGLSGFQNDVISTNGTTSNPIFGQAQQALSGRIIELQARFSF
ncbi:MAG: TonB-dependent receptor [Acidobacteriaceae bacterium]|nr:TonB-dependent receptor [Acidobacteriaceae bacterium]